MKLNAVSIARWLKNIYEKLYCLQWHNAFQALGKISL